MKLTIIGFLFLFKLCTAKVPRLWERCNLTEDGGMAACTLYNDCPIATERYINLGQVPQACSPHKGVSVVCCAGVKPISISLAKCHDYIANVTCNMEPLSTFLEFPLTSTKNYPHVAKLVYRKDGTNESFFFSGTGTLISARFVITAAVSLNGPPGFTKLVEVRFGISDLSTTREWMIDCGIDKTIAHPNYQSGQIYNNIGLIKLSEKVAFSEFIRPICLPDSDVMPNVIYRIYYDRQGITERPLVTYKRRLVRNYVCNVSYKAFSGFIQMEDNLFCTTSMVLGDSIHPFDVNGAPIVATHPSVGCSNILIGVSVEREYNYMADAAVNVFSFREWIEDIIWNEEE